MYNAESHYRDQLNQNMNFAIQKASPEKLKTVDEIINKVRLKVNRNEQHNERRTSYQPGDRIMYNQSEVVDQKDVKNTTWQNIT